MSSKKKPWDRVHHARKVQNTIIPEECISRVLDSFSPVAFFYPIYLSLQKVEFVAYGVLYQMRHS